MESLKKTNRVVFLDEDVPGGTTAYMLQEVIEKQGGYYDLILTREPSAEPRIVQPMVPTVTTGRNPMLSRSSMSSTT